MTTGEFAQVITALTALIGSVAGVFAALRIQIVKKQTNSLVTQLLIEGKDAAHAEGRALGRAEVRAELAPKDSRAP